MSKTLAEIKLKLIQWVIQLEDEKILAKIIAIKNSEEAKNKTSQ